MNYTPRKVFVDFHTTPWHRAIMLCHRRAGKSYASAAEMLKRAYNGPQDGRYFWCSPLTEQSVANVLSIFQTLDNSEGYVIKYDKTNGVLYLANGAQITLGGARTIEKIRGRYLDGCVIDEGNDVPPEAFSDVIQYCLADRQGWLAILGTAKPTLDYRMFRMYDTYKDDPKWFAKLVSVYDNKEAFSDERINEIYEETIKFCLTNGLSREQAENSFNLEFACNFDFLKTGRPNLTAMFYQELQSLFDSNPTRLLEPTNTDVVNTVAAIKTAVFDIGHSAARDYTVATIVAETPATPIVTNIIWERDKPWAYWYDYLRQQGIKNVALPFDASTVNKETMLSLVQTFKREGFNVVRIKRLLREEQVENGRWLLNNARFSKDCIAGLSQLGMFNDFTNRHGLPQDVAASVLYAGQVARKSHIKTERAEMIRKNYTSNSDAYNYGVDLCGGVIGGEF